MIRYAHVLDIPNVHPFDTDLRWTTFLGKVVKPICHGKDFLYSFSYYTHSAKLRVYAVSSEILEKINKAMTDFGLSYRLDDKGNEVDGTQTLDGDLGTERFLAKERVTGLSKEEKKAKSLERAIKVLQLQHAGCELFLDCLVEDGEYWREEFCKHECNTFNSSSRSYLHLLHNATQSKAGAFLVEETDGQMHLQCEYDLSNRVIPPKNFQGFEIEL